jgi:hypothetical protein
MRPALSLNPETATTRQQMDDEIGSDDLAHDISYAEILQCSRSDYERQDVAEPKPVVKAAEPMAEVSWTTADVMRRVSPLAFAMEAYRRGMTLVNVQKILSGTHHDSGKRKHRRKQNKSNAALVAV